MYICVFWTFVEQEGEVLFVEKKAETAHRCRCYHHQDHHP